LKENATTRLPLENNETYEEEHEHGLNEKEKCKNEHSNKEKSPKSKKRKGNEDETHGHDVKRPKLEKYIESFEHRLKDLRMFKKKHGHCNVPHQYKDDPSLGHWVANMRRAHKNIQLGKKTTINLKQARIEKLGEIGFQWEIKNKAFERNFAKLQQFKEKYGHCNVPREYKDDPSLGIWVANMRSDHKNIQLHQKPQHGLTHARIEKLEEIDFQWEIKNKSFDRHFAKLQQFKVKHGHCNVPNQYKDDPSLGKWVSRMRETYKKIQLRQKPKCRLTQAQIEKLEEIGIQWEIKNNSFERNFAKLQKYKEKHGHCDVPWKYKDDPSLAYWVANMRRAHKNLQLRQKPKCRLTQAQIEKLEEIGIQWEIKNNSFERNFAKLQNYKEKHGHCDVPWKYKDDPSLAYWVANMRRAHKNLQLRQKPKCGLTQTQIERLEETGFQWKIKNNSFERNFAKLQQFKEKHGHCDVPWKYKDDYSLGYWVGRMREAYKNIQLGKKTATNLTESRIEKLEEMGFLWKKYQSKA
jgi:predicted transcriptional regulator